MPTEPTTPADSETLERATEQLIENQSPTPEPAKEPAQQDSQAPAAEEDPADRELREAIEALEKEKAPAEPPKPDAITPPEPAKPAQGQPQPVDDGKPIMIPKARFDEVLGKLNEATGQVAYLKGVADTRSEMIRNAPAQTPTGQAVPPAEPVKTMTEQLNAIDADRLKVAGQYDNGEITFAEFTKQSTDLNRKEFQLRDDVHKAEIERVRADAVLSARREAMSGRVDENATKLEQEHPSLLQMPKEANHPRWQFLNNEAVQSLADEGIVLKQDDPYSTQLFHERIATLADKYVPIWTGKSVPAANTSPQPPSPQGGKPSLAQQRAQKITLSHQQPPPTGNMGASGSQPEITEAQIAGMTDDQIAALPDATRMRIKGVAA